MKEYCRQSVHHHHHHHHDDVVSDFWRTTVLGAAMWSKKRCVRAAIRAQS